MRRLRLIALAAVLALAAAACGDDTTPSSRSSTPATTTTPLTNQGTTDASSMTAFTIGVDDNFFKPTFIKVKDGQKLSLQLQNDGANQHTFTITGLNIDQTLDPAAKKAVEITFSGSSDVAFFCRFHAAGGMRGSFFTGSAPQGLSGGTSETDNY